MRCATFIMLDNCSLASTISLSFWLSWLLNIVLEASVTRGHRFESNYPLFKVEYSALGMRRVCVASTFLLSFKAYNDHRNDNSLKSNKQINLLIKFNIPILQNVCFVQKYFCGSRKDSRIARFQDKVSVLEISQVAARDFRAGFCNVRFIRLIYDRHRFVN